MKEGYLVEECLTFCSRYLHDGVKTRLDRRSACYDEIDAIEDQTSIFPQVGHPVGGKRTPKGKGFYLDNQSLKQAQRYIIFNCDCEQVDKCIE